jgi:hypothetical protein
MVTGLVTINGNKELLAGQLASYVGCERLIMTIEVPDLRIEGLLAGYYQGPELDDFG